MSSPSIARTSNAISTRTKSQPAGLHGGIPPLLRPLARAYLLGYGFSVGPRVFTLLLPRLLRLAQRRKRDADDVSSEQKQLPALLEALKKTLIAGTEPHRFPTFCAALVGGSTLLEVWFLRIRGQFDCARISYADCSILMIARASQSLCAYLEECVGHREDEVSSRGRLTGRIPGTTTHADRTQQTLKMVLIRHRSMVQHPAPSDSLHDARRRKRHSQGRRARTERGKRTS